MTFTTPYVSIDGIPSAVPTQLEYTNASVASAYYNSILAFVNLIGLSATSANPFPANQISAGNVSAINNALQELTNLSKYGVITTNSGRTFFPNQVVSAGFLSALGLSSKVPPSAGKSSYQLSYVTMSMAQDYDTILRSLGAVGVNVNAAGNSSPTVNLTQLQQWRDLAVQVSAIANIVQAAELEGYGGAQNLQNLIEVDYVQTGNDLITNNMAQLNSALNVTQNILNTLAQLQTLHNEVTTRSSTFTIYDTTTGTYLQFNYQGLYGATGPSAWSPIYQAAASAYFNSPVTPILISSIVPGQPGFVSAYQELVTIRQTLSAQLAQLAIITPASTRANSTSLYQTLKTVISNLNSSFTDASTGQPVISTTTVANASAGFKKWMLDNYSAFNSPNVSQAGQYQQNITFAITAGENLNDTQKETVRNFLFIFEEYYKSAASALQAITQIIQKMAQNISSS